jgi:hypothetical protein
VPAGQLQFSLVQVDQLGKRRSLRQDELILRILLLLDEVEQLDSGGRVEEYGLNPIINLEVGALEQLLLEVYGQSPLHLLLQYKTALLLLKVLRFEIVPKVILLLLADGQVVHVGGVEDELCAEVVLAVSGPQDDLDDVVDHVAVGDHAEAETGQHVDGLLRVIWSDVSVADGPNRVHSPVQRVKVAHPPPVVHDWRIGCGRIQPAD